MSDYHFHLDAQWPGGRNAVGALQCGNLRTETSIDQHMAGPGIGTNPDELFLAAAGMCFFMTFAAFVERAGLQPQAMALSSDMQVGAAPGGAFVCQRIIHRPRVVLPDTGTQDDLRLLDNIAQAAEQRCMVSNALRGNVEIVLEPEFRLGAAPNADRPHATNAP